MKKEYVGFFNKIHQAKGAEEIRKIVNDEFPDIKSRSVPQSYHLSVSRIFTSKTGDKEGKEALSKAYVGYIKLYVKVNTLAQKLSEIRSIIKKNQSIELYNASKLDKYFNIPKVVRDKRKSDYEASITEKNNNITQISSKHVLNQMRKLILSDNIYDRAISLMIASGCRPIEIFFKNKFSAVKGKPSWVKVKNIAKKREGAEDTTLERPIVMFSRKFFISEVAKLRKSFKDKIIKNKEGQLAKDKNDSLNKRVLIAFPSFKKHRQKSSMLRKIYSSLSYKLFADRKLENFNTYIQKVLGHSDLLSSFSYSFVNVDGVDRTDLSFDERERKVELPVVVEKVKSPVVVKRTRGGTLAEKFAKLEKLYEAGITHNKLRIKAKLGSSIVSAFLKTKK